MGFLSYIKEKGRQFGNWIKRTAEDVKEAWNEIKQAGREICDTVKEHYQEWRARRNDRHRKAHIKEHYHNYKPSEPDQKVAQEVINHLDNEFPRGIAETLIEMTGSQRVDAFEEMVKRGQEIMDIEVNQTVFFKPDESSQNICGYYDRKNNTLCLNEYMVTTDHPELIREQVYTIFHELVHARQWAAVTGKKDYGYSSDQLLEWANNFANYVPSNVSDEDYRKQPLERDAFGFEAIIKGEVTIEEFINANQ